MSEAEIQAFIDQLVTNGGTYGGLNFVHSTSPANPELVNVEEDNTLAPPRTDQPWAIWDNAVLQQYWTPGHLNIYFVGRVTARYSDIVPAGKSEDPRSNPPNGRSYIFINDSGTSIPST